jgi:hypothetical protein
MTDHPITPPPELVQQWGHDANLSGVPYDDETGHWAYEQHIATRAAQWGADQELEACCEWLNREGWSGEARQLRAARRPKPPSLKEQAYAALDAYIYGNPDHSDKQNTYNTIRRALEQLDD